jgi:uncharacterized protein with PIN domain
MLDFMSMHITTIVRTIQLTVLPAVVDSPRLEINFFTTNKNLLANRLTWLATKFNKKCMLFSLKYVTIRLQGFMCFIKLSNSLSLTISHCERCPSPLSKSLPNILASMIYFLKETCTFVPDINKQALIFHREWPYHMKTYTVF